MRFEQIILTPSVLIIKTTNPDVEETSCIFNHNLCYDPPQINMIYNYNRVYTGEGRWLIYRGKKILRKRFQ